jgi:hypothetical protein
MPVNLLVAIDGTGSRDWKRHDGRNSHISRFWRDFQAPETHKKYYHGPHAAAWAATGGLESGPIANHATEWISQKLYQELSAGTAQSDVRVFIVGHSRGCVSAIMLANNLQNMTRGLSGLEFSSWRLPIPIAFLGLYDTVDRDCGECDTGDGLSHVGSVYHARRANRGYGSGSRWSFDTVSISRGHQSDDFDTSHGGVGGDPGFFTALDDPTSDHYCNALTVVLTEAELLSRYGAVHPFRPPVGTGRFDWDGEAYLDTPLERHATYPPLTGDARTQRIRYLQRFLQMSRHADAFIRGGATEAGAPLATTATPHIPCNDPDDRLWLRLRPLID